MHLWTSMRNVFSSSNDGNQQSLWNDSNNDQIGRFMAVCRDILVILSCFYCCFGCGACAEDDDLDHRFARLRARV